MSQRLGGKDCRPPISYQPGYSDRRDPCQGRDLDSAGARIPCEHNGFLGVPLRDLDVESLGRKTWTLTELDAGGRLVRDTRKPWKAPRLSVEGKPFAPAPGEIGSFVAWSSRGQYVTGQVWSKAPRPRHVFVVTEAGEIEVVDERDFLPAA